MITTRSPSFVVSSRNLKVKPILSAALFLLLVFNAGCLLAQSTDKYSPKPGTVHPEFELPSIDGTQMHKLSDYKGKKLLLFHFASW